MSYLGCALLGIGLLGLLIVFPWLWWVLLIVLGIIVLCD
jgi:hypothetical protein